ncbi:act minimal PKS chain-length factor (CLF/KS beta) [Lentzea albidocapillata subsp. violacea]|uniref:Act minimal PKS chain-length factor (CLF/KS beta) n=1 Tax=Lentzea albidocapillata subsp. violacea TaxID=128104 RepID=A0A1G9LSI8_9PSEU|nr:beta-ketoacyl synthase N-terminal-like domain-containing protein [Lentzea albidocapillata]SDL65032.1 act minimal PKS chain-length factor (CLF/KS beta) [Lentzea albidocapillata subsp. violacea]
MNASSKRAVVTGLGVVAPTGIGARAHWEAVVAGKTGLGRITRFDPSGYPVRHGGEVADEALAQVPTRLVPQTDRWTQLALAGAELALRDARVDTATVPEYDMAVVTSSSSGGTTFGQSEMQRLYTQGPSWVGAYQSIAWFYAATTGQLSIRHGMRGPCGVFCEEQAGGLDVLGQASRLISSGSRLVLSGGTDASLCPYGLVAQMATGHLSTVDDPGRAYLPFDADASGHLPGEGGAMIVVESAADAASRGARSYGRLLGHAAGFDPPPGSSRPPVLASVIDRSLRAAGLRPSDVDVVFADASGVPAHDHAEARAITEVFGAGRVPVTAPKTLTGRLYGGGAALDVATALLALAAGVVPATFGPSRLRADCEIDLVLDGARNTGPAVALVLAKGHGGFTSALLLGAGDRGLPD